MGHRLSRIYTRTGDDGTTGLGDGSRLGKDHIRIEAIGTVDELNSVIGLVRAQPLSSDCAQILPHIQHDLFDLGGELATPSLQMITARHVTFLEQALDALNAGLMPLKEFILPGGILAAAHCHHARTVCRRAERSLIHLHTSQAVNPASLGYINRLSDLLFVMARHLNKQAQVPDILWQRER